MASSGIRGKSNCCRLKGGNCGFEITLLEAGRKVVRSRGATKE